MEYISEKQAKAMDMVDKLINELGDDRRWFTRCELPGITLHTFDALVFKKYLSRSEFLGVVYYRLLKKLDKKPKTWL